MAKRPAIPAEIQRQVLTEAGHRCAVCGESCPLERAHIIPWHKSKQHRAEDLICLCANCHQRADTEGWGEKTLRRWKENPWALRRKDERQTVGVGADATGAAVVTRDGNTIVIGSLIRQAAEKPPVSPLRQLPRPPADFTNRREELNELRKRVRSEGATICGLRGMGGVGKTALALVLAEELSSDYPDAQLFLDLKGASIDAEGSTVEPLRPEDALAHVIRAYHPTAKLPEDLESLGALYRQVLHGQKALILMDNARDAEQVAPLIPPAGCFLLVTSRQHFALPGLEPLGLDTLPPQDAEALLLKIAPRIGDGAGRLAELCGRLPLVLRLAGNALAARQTLGVDAYTGQLQEAKQRLVALDRYRDQSREKIGLAASIELSYALLDEAMQARWRMLGVFPGTFDTAAAAAVWELEKNEAAERLEEIHGFSLIDYGEKSERYSLHGSARDFAVARLDEVEEDAARRRHARHYLQILSAADELYLAGGERVTAGLALFDLERANIEAGQAWAAAHAVDDEEAARLCSEYADVGVFCLALRQHPRRERIPWLEAAVDAARHLDDRAAEGNHLGNLGFAFMNLGDVGRALESYEQRLTIVREIGDRRGEGNVLGNMGLAYAGLGDVRRAIEFCEQALIINREIGDRRSEGIALGNLGNAYAALSDVRRAIEFYEQALAVSREIGDRRGEGNALGNLGNGYAALGDVRRAIGFYEQQLVIVREIGDRLGEGNALGNLGNAYADLGDVRRAIELYEQALVIDREIGDRWGEGNALGNLGLAYAALGDVRRAIEFYEQALVIVREIGDRRGEGNALGNLGLAYARLGDVRRAIELYDQRLAIAREIGDRRGEGNALGNLGSAYAGLGDVRRAIEFYEQALVIDCEIGDRRGEGADLANLGSAHAKLGNRHEAMSLAQQALAILEQIEDPSAATVRQQLEQWGNVPLPETRSPPNAEEECG